MTAGKMEVSCRFLHAILARVERLLKDAETLYKGAQK